MSGCYGTSNVSERWYEVIHWQLDSLAVCPRASKRTVLGAGTIDPHEGAKSRWYYGGAVQSGKRA